MHRLRLVVVTAVISVFVDKRQTFTLVERKIAINQLSRSLAPVQRERLPHGTRRGILGTKFPAILPPVRLRREVVIEYQYAHPQELVKRLAGQLTVDVHVSINELNLFTAQP